MSLPVVISGFPSSNRDPGAFGEVLTGQGGQSAASLPKKLLVVALALAAGSITPDVQVVPITSTADADNYAAPGSEGACDLYDALQVAGNLGVPLYFASPKPAVGATQATTNIRFSGTATAQGQVTVRINGQTVTQIININDTAATAASNLAQQISGFKGGRLPMSGAGSTSYCVVSWRTPGQRGMQGVIFLDVTQMPAGMSATIYRSWAATTTYAIGDQVIPLAAPNGFYFKATAITTGTSGGSEPVWPTTIGTTVVDSGVTWTCWGNTATGNLPTTAVFLGNATGLETYTNILATLTSQGYDRIALAANDSVSLGAWKTQIDQYRGAPWNFMQHVIVASNGTQAAAQSLAQTTLNDSAFEFLWEQNAETHPSRLAASFGGSRALAEVSNPNASYDGFAITTAAAQSQTADWPTLQVIIACINNSVTPVSSWKGDGYSRVERAITTKSLTNGNADYSVLDVGWLSTDDFILIDGKLYWTTTILPNNPVVQDDPPAGQPKLPSGVMSPSQAIAAYFGKLVQYSKGVISSNPNSGTSTIPPIIQAPFPGDVSATFDQVALRIMIAENIRNMPQNHQVGISVRAQ